MVGWERLVSQELCCHRRMGQRSTAACWKRPPGTRSSGAYYSPTETGLISDPSMASLPGDIATAYRQNGPSLYVPTTSRPISALKLTTTAIFTNGAGPPKVLAVSFRSASGTNSSHITNIKTKPALLPIDRSMRWDWCSACISEDGYRRLLKSEWPCWRS